MNNTTIKFDLDSIWKKCHNKHCYDFNNANVLLGTKLMLYTIFGALRQAWQSSTKIGPPFVPIWCPLRYYPWRHKPETFSISSLCRKKCNYFKVLSDEKREKKMTLRDCFVRFAKIFIELATLFTAGCTAFTQRCISYR